MGVMAIPTEESAPVRRQVDLGRVLSLRFLGVALTTEITRLWLCRPNAARGHLVLGRNAVTARAADQGMRRNRLDVGDLRMAGGAFPRDLRRHRIMGIVTGGARF